MSTYRVTFKDNRVGRNHDVEPITIKINGHVSGETVATAVLREARKHLASRFPDVEWSVGPSLASVTGWVTAGFQTVAEWYAEEVEAA